jgi:glycogen synthase
MAPVEAMSYGTPVIAYRSGGLRETVKDKVNGIFFDQYTSGSLVKAIRRFEKMTFEPQKVYRSSKKYASGIFIKKMKVFIGDMLSKNGKI